MAGLLDLEEERRKNIAPTNPRSIAGLLGTVGENPNARMMSMAQDYARNLPQQLATNQAAMDKAIGGWNKTDFATRQPNPNYYPEAVQELTQLMPNIGALTAWHGTPHNIMGKFDISKVGTGEGAQAYGHGMYFAENPNVARSYATTGSYETPADYASHYLAESKHDPKAAIQMLKNEAALYDKKGWDKADIPKDMIPQIEEALKKGEARSNLYKVDIPDKDIPNMLDWDKPLNQQSKSVQKALAKIDSDLYSPKGMDYDPSELGQMIYSRLKAINSAKGSVQADKAASEMLNNMGVKGIRYNDAGSRAAEGGTSNFVVFDPSTVKILEKNKKKVGLLD